MKKNNITTVVILLVLSILLQGCGKTDNDSSDESERLTDSSSVQDIINTDIYADTDMSVSNLLFTALCIFPNSEYENTCYYLCFFKDGSSYSMDYCTETEDGRNYEFATRLYSSDDSCWDYADNITLVGYISEAERKELCSYITEIDLDSTFYDWLIEHEGRPDVEETIEYTFYGYIAYGEEVKPFEIQSRGKQRGVSYETNDTAAMEALNLVENSTVYSEWMNNLLEECRSSHIY